jgi:uncharacterized protein (TIGR02271 family)
MPSGLDQHPDQHLRVRFANGQEVIVPSSLVALHQDGEYHLDMSIETLLATQMHGERVSNVDVEASTPSTRDDGTLVVPVIDEILNIQTRQRETGVVEVRKTIHEHTETVDPPLYVEEVEVERVEVNRFVDGPLHVRHEGDTTIVPLLEEVLVVEKRLLLREEVHIKKARREVHNPQAVTLRQERVDIVRRPGDEENNQTATTP